MWSLQNCKGNLWILNKKIRNSDIFKYVYMYVCIFTFSMLFVSLICVGVETVGRRHNLDKNVYSQHSQIFGMHRDQNCFEVQSREPLFLSFCFNFIYGATVNRLFL